MKKQLFILLPITMLMIVSIIISLYPPEAILSIVGIKNAYFFMFLLALLGGLSTFTGVPYHFILMGLAASGLNPILLGIITSTGVLIGDSTSYVVGKKGGQIIPETFSNGLKKISHQLTKKPKLVTPFLFLYGALSPFSNDFIVISMGLINYSYLRVIIPLTVGNLFYNTALAYIGLYAFEQAQNLFLF